MSDQFPSPGQPGELPPTQIAPTGGGPQPPYQPPQPPQSPQQPPYGAPGGYPQQPQQPYGQPAQPGYPGAPGGPGYPGGGPGYPGGPGGFGPPPSGGGGKKGLIIAIVAGVVVLVLGVVAVLAFTVFKDDGDKSADDKPTKAAESSKTTESTDATEPTETESTDQVDLPTESTGLDAPAGDPKITARAFLDSLLEGDCLAVEGLTTPDYFSSEFTDQAGCKKVAGNQKMSNAQYDFQEPVVVGPIATVNGDVYAPSTGKTLVSTWILDGTSGDWLVSGYSYTEK